MFEPTTPSIFVDGDLDESIKRSASDRLGDLVPQIRARTSPGVFATWRSLAFVFYISFFVQEVLHQITQQQSWKWGFP